MAKSRETPAKCLRCAPLSPAEARAKHPTCWDDKLCTARRFYINNRDRINQKRARKRIETNHQIPVPQVNYGVLQVWRVILYKYFILNNNNNVERHPPPPRLLLLLLL